MSKIIIDWKEVARLRRLGMNWAHISEEIGVSCNVLTHKRKMRGMKLSKAYPGTKGKRKCVNCNHMFNRKYLRVATINGSRGLICKKCRDEHKKVK